MAASPQAIYGFRDGVRLQKGAAIEAQELGEHLEQLRRAAGGELTPEIVVLAAYPATSPLHPLFEWDDGEAAVQHRLHQARSLIRSVVVTYRERAADAPRQVVAFVNVKQDRRQFYTATTAALGDRAQRMIVLQQAWRDLQSFRRRYGELSELAAVFAALDGLATILPANCR